MKLLLTSQGITNPSIAAALTELVGKTPYDTKVGMILTARLAEPMRRGGFIGQVLDLWKHGYSMVDFIEPSADGIDWRTRLENVDVVFVAGGNTFHLLNQARRTGLDKWLAEQKDNKVYVGVSAGTLLATKNIDVANIPPRDNNFMNLTDLTALGLVDCEIEPHCDASRFETIEKYANTKKHTVYALDDLSAVQVIDDEVTVISEGTWKKFN